MGEAKSTYYSHIEGELVSVPKEEYDADEGGYHFARLHWTCGSAEDFKRVLIRAKDQSYDYALLQYFFTGDAHSFEPAPHGNRKHGNLSYSRTYQSVKDSIKLLDRKSALIDFTNDSDSILTVLNPCSIPSGKKQIRNLTQSAQPVDDIAGLQEKCKKEFKCDAVRFLLEVIAVPTLFVALATKRQLNDMSRFCTEEKQFSVLGIDTLFNVGQFFVTAVTYRHLLLRSDSAHIGTYPVMLGNRLQ